jgi:hypothetical protein
VLKILIDAEAHPEHFFWFGAIDRSWVESWIKTSHFEIPEDLLDFWSRTGGGDCFDSETFFRPTTLKSTAPYFIEGDDFSSADSLRVRNGMPNSYLAFHDGLHISAIRRSDRAYVSLSKRYEALYVSADFDDWYQRTLRSEFAERYGLTSST